MPSFWRSWLNADKNSGRPAYAVVFRTLILRGVILQSAGSAIPPFRSDGYLPEGLHVASEAEVIFRFGTPSRRRRKLTLRLRHWLELARQVSARRLLVDGSFVTAKDEPDDVDVVILLAPEFHRQLVEGMEPALELEEMLLTRRPEEIFAAEDDEDWKAWVEFFSRTRESDSRRKGLIEVRL